MINVLQYQQDNPSAVM